MSEDLLDYKGDIKIYLPRHPTWHLVRPFAPSAAVVAAGARVELVPPGSCLPQQTQQPNNLSNAPTEPLLPSQANKS